jgi:hypothetical protein
MCGDQIEDQICIRQLSDTFIGDHDQIKFLKKVCKIPLIGRLFLNTLSDKIYFNYEYIFTLIDCCRQISTELQHMSHSLDYKKEIQDLREEVVQNINALILLKESIMHQFPGLIRFIKTKRASYHLLEYQKKQIEHFEH